MVKTEGGRITFAVVRTRGLAATLAGTASAAVRRTSAAGNVHVGNGCYAGVCELRNRGLSTPGVPQDVGVCSHGGCGVVVGGGQVISHGGGEFPQVDAEEDGPVLVLAGRKEGQHLVHQVAGSPVAERRQVEE